MYWWVCQWWRAEIAILKSHCDACTIVLSGGTESCESGEPEIKSIRQELVKIAGLCAGEVARNGAPRGG